MSICARRFGILTAEAPCRRDEFRPTALGPMIPSPCLCKGSAVTDTSMVSPPAPEAARPSRKWTVAALLMVMVLASMEATVTSTAMPTIVGVLRGLEHYSWVASIYLLASTLSMPIYGRLADLLG